MSANLYLGSGIQKACVRRVSAVGRSAEFLNISVSFWYKTEEVKDRELTQ